MAQHNQSVLLGLFPALNLTGGVQTSGRIAWEGLTQYHNGESAQALLFCYDAGADLSNGSFPSLTKVRAKLASTFAAFKTTWTPQHVLIWHLGLLKLLPFFRVRDANVTLFLHGIECWRRQKFINSVLLRRVKLFLSNSEFTWQRFVQANPEFGTTNHQIVHLGTGSPAHTVLPPSSRMPVALMIGRIVKTEDYKGHREMIRAWPLVIQQIPEAQLWIVGDGDLKPELEQMILERGLTKNICLWGEVRETKKQQLLTEARCLALPSRGEGFGLVYLEAMRLGRPCLVSTLDAGREVIHPPDAGLAVDPADTRQMATAICALLTLNERWTTWSVQAKQRYDAHFTAAHFQRRLHEALGFGSPTKAISPR